MDDYDYVDRLEEEHEMELQDLEAFQEISERNGDLIELYRNEY